MNRKLLLLCPHCNCSVNNYRDITETRPVYEDGTIGEVTDADPNDFSQWVCEEGCVYLSYQNVLTGTREAK